MMSQITHPLFIDQAQKELLSNRGIANFANRNFILKQLERGDDYIQTKSGQKY